MYIPRIMAESARIETPEGPNIDWINCWRFIRAPMTTAFLKTPYRKVVDCVATPRSIISRRSRRTLRIAQASATLTRQSTYRRSVPCRHQNEFTLSSPERIGIWMSLRGRSFCGCVG